MNSCLNCDKETSNSKFCSRSCAASYNNKITQKRSKEGNCRICNTPISKSRSFCSDACRGKDRSIRRSKSNAKTGYEHIKNYRHKIKLMAIEYKGGSCFICGYKKAICNLDFHHKNKTLKDFTISGNYHLGWELIQKELDKCILVCKNCHGEIHSEIISV